MVAPHLIGRRLLDLRHCYQNCAINFICSVGTEQSTTRFQASRSRCGTFGQATGMAVHELLGGAHRLEFPAYASLLPYKDPQRVGRIVTEALAKGYRAIKLHEIELAPIAAARAAMGEDADLMVDTNCPWTLGQARKMARRIEEYVIHWLEEPIWPPENFPALADLRRSTPIPIAAGENVGTVREFAAPFAQEAVSYVQPSVTKIGGIGEAQKVVVLADAHNVAVAPHSPYFGPGLAATLHLSATLQQAVQIERVYLDLEASPFGAMIDPVKGMMSVPKGPGLGIEPDPHLVERYRAN